MKNQFLRSFRVISFIKRQAIKNSARLIWFFCLLFFLEQLSFSKSNASIIAFSLASGENS